MIRYISLFSGIEAFTQAVQGLPYEAVAYSEIDPFCCTLLQYYYPQTPNRGDIRAIDGTGYKDIDLIVGGSPCQSFSMSGRRQGMAGASGLVTEYLRLLREVKPTWFIWENVPGVFSIDGGDTFKALIQEWTDIGYGIAWRILDAKDFGLPQRRRRVFVIGHTASDWRSAAKVLFTPTSLSWSHQQGTQSREGDTAITPPVSTVYSESGYGEFKQSPTVTTLTHHDSKQAHTLVADIAPTVSCGAPYSKTGNSRVEVDALVAYCLQGTLIGRKDCNGPNGTGITEECAYTLNTTDRHVVAYEGNVRRLTPVECERLMGFPDGYTNILYRKKNHSPDTQRYKSLGNSMAVPIMRWLAQRILEVS